MAKGNAIPSVKNPVDVVDKADAFINGPKGKKTGPKRPDVVKKQKRVQKLVEDPTVQEKLKKKVSNKRAREDLSTVAKNGGDDSRKTKARPARPEQVSDTSAKAKSVRSRHTRRSDKNAPAASSSS